jgi:hypothetical protein
MVLLTGFTLSAVLVILAIYLFISLAVFGILMAILSNVKSFNMFLKKYKDKSLNQYYLVIFLLYILNTVLVVGFIYLRYLILNRGFLES